MSVNAHLYAHNSVVAAVNLETNQRVLSSFPRAAEGLAAVHARGYQEISEGSAALKNKEFINYSISSPIPFSFLSVTSDSGLLITACQASLRKALSSASLLKGGFVGINSGDFL